MSDKIKINPNEFALAVVSGSDLSNPDDIRASKDGLKRYLSAYMLIEEFNKMESDQFKFFKESDRQLLVKTLQSINRG
ncbi:hypothetical protein FEZ51_07570 [Pediococcus stilesii]|uniref:Uncharacterized protein n=1 Tax=Pediococcus stilesii TaxID=331679 RepID=A0A5R9BUW1_9LACO|nr:hypothetical protein [Pediococcus stilesii]TLQ03860.1 hypothetical protein FEZ51_07570 [Pediococcus stilesii]